MVNTTQMTDAELIHYVLDKNSRLCAQELEDRVAKLKDEAKASSFTCQQITRECIEKDAQLARLSAECDRLREKLAGYNAMREALESIKKQTACNTDDDRIPKEQRCWFAGYKRHSPDCQWHIAEEAGAALRGGGE